MYVCMYVCMYVSNNNNNNNNNNKTYFCGMVLGPQLNFWCGMDVIVVLAQNISFY